MMKFLQKIPKNFKLKFKQNISLKKRFRGFYAARYFNSDIMKTSPFIKAETLATNTNMLDNEKIVIHEGEVKDSLQIFELAWSNIANEIGEVNMSLPKEILFLAGAPGAGKGEMTDFIKKVRGITAETIETSKLLQSPEAEKIKSSGGLVASRHVVQLLLKKLLEKQFHNGVIVDGFPRTEVQGECIKHLRDKMLECKNKFANTPHSEKFNRPIFSITVLFIEEELSIQRQLMRGEKVMTNNRRVRETGVGSLLEIRNTDFDEELARKRYRQFKDNIFKSLEAVKSHFNFHFVLADADPAVVKSRILKELEYQSSSELLEETFEKVQKLPLPCEVTKNARLNIIKRLDDYAKNHSVLFDRIIEMMLNEFFEIIKFHANSGKVVIRSENTIFKEPYALRMALDLFTERGYDVSLDQLREDLPRVIEGGNVHFEKKRIYKFTIKFLKPTLRHTSRFML